MMSRSGIVSLLSTRSSTGARLLIVVGILGLALVQQPSGRADTLTPEQQRLQQILAERHYWQHQLRVPEAPTAHAGTDTREYANQTQQLPAATFRPERTEPRRSRQPSSDSYVFETRIGLPQSVPGSSSDEGGVPYGAPANQPGS